MKKNQLATDKDSKKTSLTKIAKQTPVKITQADETRIKNTLRDLLECYYYHKNYIFEWSFLFTDSTPREELNFDIHGIILNTLGIKNNELADTVSEAISDSDIPQLDASDSADLCISKIIDLIEDDGRYKINEFSQQSCLMVLEPLIAMNYILTKLCAIKVKGDSQSPFNESALDIYQSKAVGDKRTYCLLTMINHRFNRNPKSNIWDDSFNVICSYIDSINPFESDKKREHLEFIESVNKMIHILHIKEIRESLN